jgi:hypothetical protein
MARLTRADIRADISADLPADVHADVPADVHAALGRWLLLRRSGAGRQRHEVILLRHRPDPMDVEHRPGLLEAGDAGQSAVEPQPRSAR